MVRTLPLLLLAVLLLLGHPAAAQPQPLAERLEAARTLARVQTALAEDDQLDRFVLNASAQEGGAVALSGTVASEALRQRAEQVARDIPGVGRVTNNVQVDPRVTRPSGPLPPPIRASQPEVQAAPPAEAESRPAPPEQSQAEYHQVRSGDTLGAIARRYGVSVQQIQRLNNLRGTNIRVGQRLRVK